MEIETGSMIRFKGSGNVYKLQEPNVYDTIIAEPVAKGVKLLLSAPLIEVMLKAGVIEEATDG